MILSILSIVAASILAPMGAVAAVESSQPSVVRTPGVHELRVQRELTPNFDAHVLRLAQVENQYRERLPMMMGPSRWGNALDRILKERYQFNQNAAVQVRQSAGTVAQ